MSNWFPQRKLGTSLGLSQASTPLGGAVGTPIVVALIEAFGGNWRAPFIILGAIGILFLLGWWVVVRDRPEGHPWVKRVEAAVGADEPERSLFGYLRMPIVLATALTYFGYTWVLFTFLTWFPDFLHEAHHLDLSQIAVTGSIPWLCGFVGLALGGVFTDALGRRIGLFNSRKWTTVVGLLLVACAFGPVGIVRSAYGAVALMAVTVFILYIVGAQFFAIIGPVIPYRRFGSVSGFVHFIANIAGIIAPIVLGYVVDATGSWELSFVVSAIVVAVPAILLAVLGKDRRRYVPSTEPAAAAAS
jgi:ACS family hexuronate transporter-like MFS transporter